MEQIVEQSGTNSKQQKNNRGGKMPERYMGEGQGFTEV